MAHIGKEIALGLIGCISGLLCFSECLLHHLAIRDKSVDFLRHTDKIGFGKD